MLKQTKLVNKILHYAQKVYSSLETEEQKIKDREAQLKLDKAELDEVKRFLERLLK